MACMHRIYCGDTAAECGAHRTRVREMSSAFASFALYTARSTCVASRRDFEEKKGARSLLVFLYLLRAFLSENRSLREGTATMAMQAVFFLDSYVGVGYVQDQSCPTQAPVPCGRLGARSVCQRILAAVRH